MASTAELTSRLEWSRTYLLEELLPFWIERAPDRECGGFLSYFDRQGKPGGGDAKSLLMQARLLHSFASAQRAGFHAERCAELARTGAEFLLEHYRDREHGGWFWMADRCGRPLDERKIGYGQCFALYALSEHYLASGDARAREAAEWTFDVISQRMRDRERGGYLEIFERDWRPAPPGRGGGDRKSFDVHMHMMEALTRAHEALGGARCRSALEEIIALIAEKMLDPATGVGLQHFALDFTPRPAIELEVIWGRDAFPGAEGAPPVLRTSYGHNVEFAWLLLHAADLLGVPRSRYEGIVEPIFAHCCEHGIDWRCGGVFVEGPLAGPASNRHKQFWQQAEVMIGMLDAWSLLGEERFWRAFCAVHDFVREKFVNHAGGGEWYALLDREGRPIEDYLGDEWKISYHTVRAMIEVVRRLEAALEEARA